jgi:DNA repair exonuclease SbcCD ATPase subunit
MDLTEYRKVLERKKGKKEELEKNRKELKVSINELERQYLFAEEAQRIIQKISEQTQSSLEYHLSEIVTLALSTIFPDPYQFKLKFIPKRGKTECQSIFIRNGKEYTDIMYQSGGGPISICSFALKISLWSLNKPRTRNVLFLDEPFTALKGLDYPSKAGELLQVLAKKLNLQIIVVSHTSEIINYSDKIFEVKLRKGRSEII